MTPTQIARVATVAARKADAMSKDAVWYSMRFQLMAFSIISATIAAECKAIANDDAHEL
jgi:hypothetical protein